jgi:hypothetical protein
MNTQEVLTEFQTVRNTVRPLKEPHQRSKKLYTR